MTKNNDAKKIKVFNLVNRIKRKLGRDPKSKVPGFIAPEAIAEADKLIEILCADCPKTIAAQLAELDKFWVKMRDTPEGPERTALTENIFTVAHEIKDIAGMCGFSLIAYFAESLRDYIDKAEPNVKAQKVIVQAHIDAMNTTHKQGLKADGGPLSDELKSLVKIAIKKYS